MGNASNVKAIRGQIRQIVKELLPELMREELTKAIYTDLLRDINLKLAPLSTQVNDMLQKLDQRSKDSLGYLVRQASSLPVTPIEPKSKGDLADGQTS